jgi:hypothetical protein
MYQNDVCAPRTKIECCDTSTTEFNGIFNELFVASNQQFKAHSWPQLRHPHIVFDFVSSGSQQCFETCPFSVAAAKVEEVEDPMEHQNQSLHIFLTRWSRSLREASIKSWRLACLAAHCLSRPQSETLLPYTNFSSPRNLNELL